MTADMVDGMGTTGTQGVFQRCAEETLRVLREDSEVILTVLEVFKYDPLHSWCVLFFFSLSRVLGSVNDLSLSLSLQDCERLQDQTRTGLAVDGRFARGDARPLWRAWTGYEQRNGGRVGGSRADGRCAQAGPRAQHRVHR